MVDVEGVRNLVGTGECSIVESPFTSDGAR